jgi:phosphoribosylformylglycinamidine cyclo-ligase
MKGVVKGADEAECIVPGGEIGDVPELIKGLVDGKGFDMVFASVGEVRRENLVSADDLEPDDAVIGLRSSGIHSNGISLARKVLFKQWGGEYKPFCIPEGLDRELIYEALEPTRIYVKAVGDLVSKRWVKAAVHVTGDAYLKFGRLSQSNRGVGFEFNNFKPQPIFSLIQEASEALGTRISDAEMFRTFNMGWGFAVIVSDSQKDEVVDSLERSGVQAEQIGRVTASGNIIIRHGNKKILLEA